MEEVLKAVPKLIVSAPWAFAAIAIVWIVLKNGGSEFLKSFKPSSEYVKRSDCHGHIKTLTIMIKDVKDATDKIMSWIMERSGK